VLLGFEGGTEGGRAGRKLRVVDVVPVEEEGSPYVGFLRVAPA
jgi:hypothetical protein